LSLNNLTPGPKKFSLASYGLLAGLAASLAVYVWHVWSDNAYLYLYFLAIVFYLITLVLILGELVTKRGWLKVAAIVVAAVALSLSAIRFSGADRSLANQILAGGNGSQSPCLAELFGGLTAPPGGVTITAEELRVGALSEVSGGLDQALITFSSILLLLLATLWPIDRMKYWRALRGVEFAGIFSLYLYLRGPGAWCGQAWGLDIITLAAILGFILLKTSPKYLL
jgi:hypothetical protein